MGTYNPLNFWNPQTWFVSGFLDAFLFPPGENVSIQRKWLHGGTHNCHMWLVATAMYPAGDNSVNAKTKELLSHSPWLNLSHTSLPTILSIIALWEKGYLLPCINTGRGVSDLPAFLSHLVGSQVPASTFHSLDCCAPWQEGMQGRWGLWANSSVRACRTHLKERIWAEAILSSLLLFLLLSSFVV